MELKRKIDQSIALIRKAEKLALAMQPDKGFYVGFSGGKDSQVVLELVKMAGVKYHAVYNVTTNDPADNVRFIKKHYSEVEFSVPEKSYFQLIAKKGLPTMRARWCCALFKENSGVGFVVLTGVRREESSKRAKYNNVAKYGDKESRVCLEKMEANEFRCVGGKDKFLVYPILEWTEKDVWDFIALHGLPINPCYKSHKRVGCVFCPFASKKEILAYCNTHPKLKEAFIHAIERYISKDEDGSRWLLASADETFDWWLSKVSINEYIAGKRQIKITFTNPSDSNEE